MDWRIILPIVAILLFTVLFGNNPFEPPPGSTPRDPFQAGIDDKISGKTDHQGGFSGGYTEAPTVPGSSVPLPMQEGLPPDGTANTATGGYGGYGSGAAGQPQPDAEIEPPPASEMPALRATQPQAPAGNPLQPAPFQGLPGVDTTTTAPQSSVQPLRIDPVLSRITQDGTRVSFDGSTVYIEGTDKLMADGDYPMRSGPTLIVRSGKRQFPPNYFSSQPLMGGNG